MKIKIFKDYSDFVSSNKYDIISFISTTYDLNYPTISLYNGQFCLLNPKHWDVSFDSIIL